MSSLALVIGCPVKFTVVVPGLEPRVVVNILDWLFLLPLAVIISRIRAATLMTLLFLAFS